MTALVDLSTPELLDRASRRRDELFGTRVTYSPKVFIPLTKLCRDRCGYCTFAESPRTAAAPYLEPAEVLAIASQGAAAGCHEALFTLGEAPELRYPAAAEWLAARGHASTVSYLTEVAALVLGETGLLPHANAGALGRDDLALLRTTCASQGMMVESLRPDLAAHRGAPDKEPARRLATLDLAGRLAIPFTTGILVGIGESETDRLEALEAIAASHLLHGHVQEVIVQNFLPKPGTAMRDAAPCSHEDHVRAIALARLVLPDDVHVQAPPNLSAPEDLAGLLAAGIDDWGGVSPVTADHVNPERPWPSLDVLRAATEAGGHQLAPRLTTYPSHAAAPERWLDPAVRFPVLDRADADLLGRDDPGALWPERHRDAANVGTGAEVVQIGRRSTAWFSGAGVDPVDVVGAHSEAALAVTGRVREVLDGVRLGQEVGAEELEALFAARGAEVAAVAAAADEVRRRVVGDEVTYVVNRNINYTNVCTYKCTFCGFSKGPLSLNLRGAPYLLTLDDVADRSEEAAALGATEVCLQGGIHPSFDGDFYVDVTRAVHERVPDIHIHGFTALEVLEGSRRLGEPLESYLLRLKDAGLRSLPGTAAEILDDEVRAVLCPDKVTTEEWLEVHRVAHSVGLRSNVTMMFGSIERPHHWVRHLLRTRALQRETGGFTEFVGLPFVHMAAPIYLKRGARRGPTWRETVLVHAVARIAYADDIAHVQASWVKLGPVGAGQLLAAGVDDLGGTLMDENISRAAGASHGQGLTPDDLAAIARRAGRPLRQRSTLYGEVVARVAAAVVG
ncbi:2-phospho-L-lactate guanylyltransferase [Nocardioides sp. Soil774]|uniref:5-amino-6-(D-ribitylamino)uracil--L-tyrosine 4-hydroxyphenyl transferase CofH n=1 Tax=Nocardioides sp. Soil774 TaxID=1736408 RepID=UPI0006F3F85C|nr:5-amino-6-(D-ribitylamino)uracil--L-tyrosine 4-hydroxyphenyl transferase CofH [Nocardioides sp. Soil774]KRE94116.1 2-phospho-L-lactate guanylyltransferase [Nocardioides sp. Soil774]